MEELNNELPIINDKNVYNNPTKSVPVPEPEIGIDVKNSVTQEILKSDDTSRLNTTLLNSFLDVSRSRDTQYDIIDQMCQDSIPSAILESFAEDATATNENKESIWCVADDPKIAKTVQFIINSLQLNKNIHKYTTSFIKYGDVYLKLYRQSDYKTDPLFDKKNNGKENLNEDINLHIDSNSDHLVSYVELVDNPATTFELTRFGKTAGFIQTHIDLHTQKSADVIKTLGNNIYQYSFNQRDVDIYEPTRFVHASLDDDVDRAIEEVEITLDNTSDKKYKDNKVTYKVRSGQSLFYNTFRIWRELSLLENSLMLSRLTKSSITRVIQVETGNVAKEEVSQILQSVKQMIEQKASLNPGTSMAEYTNPGPIENNIYMATHDGKGAITTSQIGGDYDPKQLTDLDYFKNKWWGSFGIPKQYFGDTNDSTGFNGGTSLSIISSKYAKKIVKIQSAIIQMVTSLINIFLIDKGLSKYVNKFTIKMLEPVTQEEIDRKDSITNSLRLVTDTMSLLQDVEDKAARLKILKALISNVVNNNEVIDVLEKEIEKLEDEIPQNNDENENNFESDFSTGEESGLDLDNALGLEPEEEEIPNIENAEETVETTTAELPTPGETGVDLVNNIPEE